VCAVERGRASVVGPLVFSAHLENVRRSSPAYILLCFESVAFACSGSRGVYMAVMFAHGRALGCVGCVEVGAVA